MAKVHFSHLQKLGKKLQLPVPCKVLVQSCPRGWKEKNSWEVEKQGLKRNTYVIVSRAKKLGTKDSKIPKIINLLHYLLPDRKGC